MLRSNHFGSKEFYQAIVFLLLFSSTIINNAIETAIAGSLAPRTLLIYTIALSGFIVLLAPILFLRGRKYTMFILLYIMSIVSISLTEIGSFTILLACYTTIYALKNNVLPKNLALKIILVMGLLNALGISIYYSANSNVTGLVSGISLYIAGTFIFGLEFGFSSRKVAAATFNLTENEIRLIELLPLEYPLDEMSSRLGKSSSMINKIIKSLKEKTEKETLRGITLWARDQGLI